MQDAEEHKSSLPTDNNQSMKVDQRGSNAMRESESEHASDGDEGESRAENRGKRKESSFVVESKVFEVGAEERKGKI